MSINGKVAFAGLAVSVAAVLAGWVLLGQVNEIANRTEQAIAIYEDETLTYATGTGALFTVPQEESCKRYGKSPSRECLAFFENGDEVVVTFDSADPTRTWKGPTPGGLTAAGLFWGGIALGIFSLFWLWFTSPWYRRLRRPEIAGQASLPPNEE